MHNCQVDIEHVRIHTFSVHRVGASKVVCIQVKDELALLSRSLTDVLEVHAYFESVELALE